MLALAYFFFVAGFFAGALAAAVFAGALAAVLQHLQVDFAGAAFVVVFVAIIPSLQPNYSFALSYQSSKTIAKF